MAYGEIVDVVCEWSFLLPVAQTKDIPVIGARTRDRRCSNQMAWVIGGLPSLEVAHVCT